MCVWMHQVVRRQGLRGETAQEREESKRAYLHPRPCGLGSDCVKVGHVFIASDCVLSAPDGLGFRRGGSWDRYCGVPEREGGCEVHINTTHASVY